MVKITVISLSVGRQVRSPSINIIAEDEQMRGVDVDVKAIH